MNTPGYPAKGTLVYPAPGSLGPRDPGRVVGRVATWCAACQRKCRIAVRWSDGELTRVCKRALVSDNEQGSLIIM